MRAATLAGRATTGLALAVLAAILCFYIGRLAMPQPIYATDVGSYVIRAVFPQAAVADPTVAQVSDSVFLVLIRALHALSGQYLAWARGLSLAAYFGGLAAVWKAASRSLPPGRRWGFLLLALAFPYYRFVVAVLPEGVYVGVLTAICVATAQMFATRPRPHAVLAGALAAALALVKPHGVTVYAALAALAALDGIVSRRPSLAAARLGLLSLAFFGVGNLIQLAAGEHGGGVLTFFVGAYYHRSLAAAPPPGAWRLGWLAAGSMVSAMALLAGVPAAVALGEIAARWRNERRRFTLSGQDALVLLLVLAALATLAMVSLFAVKAAVQVSETRRLWGRYFEFYAPLIWLAAAPQLERWSRTATQAARLRAAGVVLAGLTGLLLSLRAGIVLYPWDATALTAFFHPDPVRAPLGVRVPYRALATAASLAAAAAITWRAPPWRAWLGLFLALGLLSTWLDHVWMGPLVAKRTRFDAEIRVAAQMTPEAANRNALLAADTDGAHLGFLGLGGFAHVVIGRPGAPPAGLDRFENLVVVAPATPPMAWGCGYQGEQVKVCVRPAGAGRATSSAQRRKDGIARVKAQPRR